MNVREIIDQLNSIDFSEIRGDNIGSWPLVVRILACVFAFVAVVIVYYMLQIKDMQSELGVAKARESTLRSEFSDLAYQAANLDAYRLQMKELELRLDTLVGQLPEDTEVPGLLEDITETGLAAGLTINSIQLLPEKSHDYYVELPIEIVATGGYHDFATFVSGVSGLPRIVTLHDFAIRSSNSGGQQFTIEARTYRYREGRVE